MIHNRLNLYRTERGLSRKDLAERVDVNPQTIGFLERGDYNPSVELALRLARSRARTQPRSRPMLRRQSARKRARAA